MFQESDRDIHRYVLLISSLLGNHDIVNDVNDATMRFIVHRLHVMWHRCTQIKWTSIIDNL